MWRKLRGWLTPIPNTALPSLTRQLDIGVRFMSISFFVLSILFLGLQAALDRLDFFSPRLLSTTVFYLGTYAASRRGWANADTLLWLLASYAMAITAAESWRDPAAFGGVGILLFPLPLLFAAFMPWRPTYSLLMVVPAAGIPSLLAHTQVGAAMASPILLSLCGISCGVLAAVSNQFHRRLRLRLEQTQSRLMAAERVGQLGRLTAAMAHELKTPVGTAMTEAEMLRRLNEEFVESIGHHDVTENDFREIGQEAAESLVTLRAALERAGRYLSAMREHTMARQERPAERLRVATYVDGVATLLTPALRRAKISLQTNVDDTAEIFGDPGALDRILLTLMQNAVDALASNDGGEVVVTVEKRRDDVLIRVSDDGPGVPPEHRDDIFEPLFTTKLDGDGTGLGLSICRDLAEMALGGHLRLAESARGACFELRCPSDDASVRANHPPAPKLDENRTWRPPQELSGEC